MSENLNISNNNQNNPNINPIIQNEVPEKDIKIKNEPQIQNEPEVKEPIAQIVNGVSLMTLFHLSDPESNLREDKICEIKIKGMKFLDCLTTIKEGTTYAPINKIDLFKDIFNMDNFLTMGFNDMANSLDIGYARPGIINFTLVCGWDDATQRVDINDYNVPLGPDVPNADMNEPLNCYRRGILQAVDVMRGQQPQQDTDVDTFTTYFCGGPSWIHQNNDCGYNLWFQPDILHASNSSYIAGPYGELMSTLNAELTKKKDLLQRMGYTQLKDSSNTIARLISYLYNCSSWSTLDYSPLLDQLKLLLYCDASSTLFDHILNFNQGSIGHMIIHEEPITRLVANRNPYRKGQRDIYLAYCDMNQYELYQEGDLDITPELEDREIKFVPIKAEWLKRKDDLMTYAISLAPYPIVSANAEMTRYDIDVDVDRHQTVLNSRQVLIEHNSSKIFIEGSEVICFVVVDWPEDNHFLDPDDENYDEDLFTWDAYAYTIPNLAYGRGTHDDDGSPIGIQNARGAMLNHLWRYLDGDWRASINLIKQYRNLIGWEFDESLLMFIALITTNNLKNVVSGRDVRTYINQQVAAFLPMLRADDKKFHGYIPEPDFMQRCYALIGMVKQRSSTFIQDVTWMQFSRLMYANRLLIGAAKSQFCSLNQIPAHISTVEEVGYFSQQREKGFYAWLSHYFNISKDLLSTRYGHQLVYHAPTVACPDTTSDMEPMQRQFNEYCDVEDWVNLFSHEVTYPPSNIVSLDNDQAKANDISFQPAFIQGADLVVFKSSGGLKAMKDSINLVLKAFHRTLPFSSIGHGNQVFGLAFISARKQYDPNQNINNVWEFVWKIAPWTWREVWNMLEYHHCASGIRCMLNGFRNSSYYSQIRVLDYAYPTFDWATGDLYALGMTRTTLERPNTMCVFMPSNKSAIYPQVLYDELPVFPDLVMP